VKNSPPSAETHPNSFAWFVLIQRFHESVRNSWAAAGGAAAKGGKAAPKQEAKKEEPKKAAADDDDFDPFADNGDDEVTIK
jgi:hypothetical protein